MALDAASKSAAKRCAKADGKQAEGGESDGGVRRPGAGLRRGQASGRERERETARGGRQAKAA